MPWNSKHNSSKHSSRDAREYSDSDKDSILKERISKEENGAKATKDLSFSEKRKLESKDANDMHVAENGDYDHEHGSSKRRKERRGDGVGVRWNGGEEEGGEGSKRSKASGHSKIRRRDDSVGVYGDDEKVKMSSGRSVVKHKDSSRKESKEDGTDKERTIKKGRRERLMDSEEQRSSKQVADNNDHNISSDLQSADSDSQLDKRMRKKGGSGEGGKYAEEAVEVYDRRLSKDESGKDGEQKKKGKDERYKDKHRDEVHKDHKHQREKQKVGHPANEHTSSRSDEKHVRQEKDITDLRQKKCKPQEGVWRDYDGDLIREFNSNIESSCDLERNHERNHIRDRDNMPNRNCDYDHDYDYKRDRVRDWEHYCNRERDREHEHDCYHDREGSHVDDRSARYKDTTGQIRSIDDHDECAASKSRAVKGRCADNEKRFIGSMRAESNADRGRSQSRQTHIDSFRSLEVENVKHRDVMTGQKIKISREGPNPSGPPEGGPKYKSMDKLIKTDAAVVGIQTERSSGSKASPVGLNERYPSTGVDHRGMSRSSIRRSLDILESGRRNGIDPKDFTSEDRVSQDISPEKSSLNDSNQADSSFYDRIGQGNTSVVQKTTPFRAQLDRPSMGSLEDGGRDYPNAQFRRSVDPGFGRVPCNTLTGVPNSTSPVPNNFVPFQHGTTHFQAMFPQFPSQPVFGMRPPMEVNHAGIPFHIPDVDRFPGHLHPFAWQNIMDSSGCSNLHGWDGNNSVFRDAEHMYNKNYECDWTGQLASSQAWESSVETWKEQSCDVKKDVSSLSSKHDSGLKPQIDEVNRVAHDEMENLDRLQEKIAETKASCFTPRAKETLDPVPTSLEKTPDTSLLPNFGCHDFSHFYLSKLDISLKLTNPEVHDRCMALLSPKTTSHENDIVDGKRVKINRLKHSLFPLIDNSVFQRAMDLYKKQSTEVGCIKSFNRITRDNIFASDNEVQVKESLYPGLEKKEDSAMVSEENTSICASHDDKLGHVSTTGEECQQDPMLIPSMDGGGRVDSSVTSAAQQVEISSGGELGEPMSVSINYSNETRASEQQVNSGDVNGYCFPKNNVVAAASTSSVSGSKAGNDLACGPDEMKAASNNSLSDPLVFEDGSKICASLMPESNKFESLIFTRIHHSAENTH